MDKNKIIMIIAGAIIALAIIFLIFRKRIIGTIMEKLEFVDNQKMRNDSQGLGHYHAPRGNRLHDGVDIVTTPGQVIIAPEDLKIVRRARPTNEGGLDGLMIELKDGRRYKLFYVAPAAYSGEFKKGDMIAIAQNMTSYYNSPGMINHMHIEREDKKDLTNEIMLL